MLIPNSVKFRLVVVSIHLSDKIAQNENDLSNTCPLWSPQAEFTMRHTEDVKFLQLMKSDRSASFGPFDRVMDGRMQRKHQRAVAEKRRREISEDDVARMFAFVHTSDEELDTDKTLLKSDENESVMGAVTEASRRAHRSTKVETHAFKPPHILKSPKLVALSTRTKITPAQQAVFTKALIEETGGDT